MKNHHPFSILFVLLEIPLLQWAALVTGIKTNTGNQD